jgi:hypothetical protein
MLDGEGPVGRLTESEAGEECACIFPSHRLHWDPLKSSVWASAGNSRQGAVAQSVERSPEKAGVGGSIPPCPTCRALYS